MYDVYCFHFQDWLTKPGTFRFGQDETGAVVWLHVGGRGHGHKGHECPIRQTKQAAQPRDKYLQEKVSIKLKTWIQYNWYGINR